MCILKAVFAPSAGITKSIWQHTCCCSTAKCSRHHCSMMSATHKRAVKLASPTQRCVEFVAGPLLHVTTRHAIKETSIRTSLVEWRTHGTSTAAAANNNAFDTQCKTQIVIMYLISNAKCKQQKTQRERVVHQAHSLYTSLYVRDGHFHAPRENNKQ